MAGAQAQFISSQNDLVTAKLLYEKIIGPLDDIDSLGEDVNIEFDIPTSLQNAIQISKGNNPDLTIAKLELSLIHI